MTGFACTLLVLLFAWLTGAMLPQRRAARLTAAKWSRTVAPEAVGASQASAAAPAKRDRPLTNTVEIEVYKPDEVSA